MAAAARTTARDVARRRAVELVFESLQRRQPASVLLEGREAPPPYALTLVQGVEAHQTEITEWLDTYSHGWPSKRMPAVDRAILYVGAYEVVFEPDVPDQVILKAAADLAAKLSTDKSPNFVSGLLGRISQIKETL
ncbi:MAG: transcription antitermination protein NusB [Bifidobacteriaceae bacterium]|jgi:N utilization substance protein B|nr:transcription antitermination protein NusB [Bifidobacteriaceae bacterium]